jgi:hypothetical protein
MHQLTRNLATLDAPTCSLVTLRAHPFLDLATFPLYSSSYNYMHRKRFIPAILVLLLAFGFLATQLHSCADLSAGLAGSHLCPLCTTTGSAIISPTPSIVPVSDPKPFESLPVESLLSADLSPSLSPRAPPAL